MTEMIKCPCGCGCEIINFTPTNEEMRDKLEKEYFAAIKERDSFLGSLFGAAQSKLDRARERLVRFDEEHGYK